VVPAKERPVYSAHETMNQAEGTKVRYKITMFSNSEEKSCMGGNVITERDDCVAVASPVSAKAREKKHNFDSNSHRFTNLVRLSF